MVVNTLSGQRVLVLNRLWQAVNVCSVERAMALLCTGHAQVVYEEAGHYHTFSFGEWCDFTQAHDGDDVVRTISIRIRIPKIILLLFFDRIPKKDVKFTRNNLFERDKNTCQYCGKKFERKDLNIDHVIPRQFGGKTTWENIVCSCIACNSHKANRLPHEAHLRLIRKPSRPKWRPIISTMLDKQPRHPAWKHFLDVAYWNVELDES